MARRPLNVQEFSRAAGETAAIGAQWAAVCEDSLQTACCQRRSENGRGGVGPRFVSGEHFCEPEHRRLTDWRGGDRGTGDGAAVVSEYLILIYGSSGDAGFKAVVTSLAEMCPPW